jgi:hypothetical protein
MGTRSKSGVESSAADFTSPGPVDENANAIIGSRGFIGSL